MKMAGTLCTILIYLGLTHLHASETGVPQPLCTLAINYDASAEQIKGESPHKRNVFTPLPTTLHELYERNDKAKALHRILHTELSRILKITKDRGTMLSIFADYGIGIRYAPCHHTSRR